MGTKPPPEGVAAQRALRVVAVIEDSQFGGPAKNLLRFAANAGRGLTPYPIEVEVVTFLRDGQKSSPLVTACRDSGIHIVELRERRRFDVVALRSLKQVVLAAEPAVLQTHNVKSHLFAVLSGLQRSIPWVAFHHGYTRVSRIQRWYDRLDRFTLPRADRIVAVCGAFAEQLSKRGVPRSNISVLHNSIDVANPADTRREQPIRPSSMGRFRIVVVGRLADEKGHSFLFRAFRRLLAEKDLANTELLVVGDGPERNRLESEVERGGLARSVVFTGHVKSPADYIETSAALVLSSSSEGSPNVLLEAMAAGVPVVATAVGGVPEIIRDSENGLLVPYGDEAAMATALAAVLRSSSLRQALVARALNDVEVKYSPSAYAKSMSDIYLAAIEHAQSRRDGGGRA